MTTVYLLSTENLGHDPEELELLFNIIADIVDKLAQSPNDVRLRMVGHLELLSEGMATRLRRDEEVTANSTGIQVSIAVGYGGRQEIVDAARRIIRESVTEEIDTSELEERITTDTISRRPYTSG